MKQYRSGREHKASAFLAALVFVVIVAIGSFLGKSSNSAQVQAKSAKTTQAADKKDSADAENTVSYTFRNSKLLNQHYEKHGIEMGFDSAEEYEEAASAVVNNPDALHKTEAEDGDDVYYVEDTNEFVIVSTDGYIRTYFNPSAGIDYFNRQ